MVKNELTNKECEELRQYLIDYYGEHRNRAWGTYDILLYIRRAYRYAKYCGCDKNE